VSPRYLLDTHVVVRWLAEPKKLSREQTRALDEAQRQREPVAVSAMTLLEIAMLFADRSHRIRGTANDIFAELKANPIFQIFPLTIDIAFEVGFLGSLIRDPADRAIVATARVHRLRLLTSDQRIAESNLVSVIE
jgi:PIN domain nuclease of toxin-antitoxin system